MEKSFVKYILGSPAYRFLAASFLWSFGANLIYFFLNFHLEGLGYGRQAIGLAQALLLLVGVVSALPLASRER